MYREKKMWREIYFSDGGAPDLKLTCMTRKCCALAVIDIISPPENDEFDWPSLEETRKVQEEELKKHNHYNFIKDEESLLWVDGVRRIWIPDDAINLQPRLCVVAHAGPAGHRGFLTTLARLSRHVLWKTLTDDVKQFVDKCLHCLGANGEKCPRTYGESLRATKPNERLHFDFLSMPKGLHGFCYVLVLEDGMSGFCEFVPTTMANTAVTVQAILDWFKRYGVVLLWVSDQGPYRVVATLNDWTYDIQELVDPFGNITRHVTRLKFFREKDLGVTEDLKDYVVCANGGHLVRSFLDCLLNPDTHQWEVLVQWIGSDDTENIWEPASILAEDVPNLLRKCVADDSKAVGMRSFI
uniref:AlNc14C147G7406 protein n=1 Tax=Albugo laibachii Nc14 TaxID=890382 RepID=F0WLL7_9STRA|nr:AlNc14C147G7406 [Albugo laibachii Nc14]|eukprot:CCA22183.1 AlNc14C147G7406 [Albugo laibachii Nc14]